MSSPSCFEPVIGSGDLVYPPFVGNEISTVTINSTNGVTPQTLLTGSPYYYLTRFYVTVDPVCTVATSGMVQIVAYDSVVGIIGKTRIWLPSAVPTLTVPTPSLISDSGYGFFYLSPNSGSVVTVYPSVALTGGQIRVTANYGLTNTQGQ